jgi:hypothetical protein
MEEETFLLPFKTIEDLIESVDKLKKAWGEQGFVHREKLRANNVDFDRIGDYGLSLDLDLIPKNLNPQDVCNWFRETPIIDNCNQELNVKTVTNK